MMSGQYKLRRGRRRRRWRWWKKNVLMVSEYLQKQKIIILFTWTLLVIEFLNCLVCSGIISHLCWPLTRGAATRKRFLCMLNPNLDEKWNKLEVEEGKAHVPYHSMDSEFDFFLISNRHRIKKNIIQCTYNAAWCVYDWFLFSEVYT